VEYDAVSFGEWFRTFQRLRHQDPSKCRKPLTQRHGVTVHKVLFLKYTVVETLKSAK